MVKVGIISKLDITIAVVKALGEYNLLGESAKDETAIRNVADKATNRIVKIVEKSDD